MPFGWTTLECEGRSIRTPIRTPIDDLVVSKVMRCGLLLDRHGLNGWVIPEQRPVVFSVHVSGLFQPRCNALGFTTAKALRHPVENVVVGVKSSPRMRAFV